MESRVQILSLVIVCILGGLSCEKAKLELGGQEGISLTLLEKYTPDGNTWAIDESSVKVQRTPLLTYEDILSYDQGVHTFSISDKAAQAIGALENNGHGLAFAILADGKLMYTAYFWASFSSSSCDWTVADPIFAKSNKELMIRLGYASPTNGKHIPDRRNDQRILFILKSDGKLIE